MMTAMDDEQPEIELSPSVAAFIEVVQLYLGGSVSSIEDGLISWEENSRYPLAATSCDEIENFVATADAASFDQISLHRPGYLEVLVDVDELTRMRIRRMDPDADYIDLIDRDFSIKLGPSSREFTFRWMREMVDVREARRKVSRYAPFYGPSSRRRSDINAIDLLPRVFRENSLRIQWDPEWRVQPKEILEAALFHLAYHRDLVLSPRIATETPKIPRPRDLTPVVDLDIPRLLVNSELCARYLAATKATDPVSSYLGYYHVLEYNFDPLMNQYVVDKATSLLTDPNFSLRNPTSIQNVAKQLASLYIERRGEFVLSDEKKSLTLVLEKYITAEKFRNRIANPQYENYLANNEVAFCSGNKINLNAPAAQFFGDLASRIYSTRNSIVHAKSSESDRYEPNRHAAALRHEIMLVRAIAEEVIIQEAIQTPDRPAQP